MVSSVLVQKMCYSYVLYILVKSIQWKPLNRETDKRDIRLIGGKFGNEFVSNSILYIA